MEDTQSRQESVDPAIWDEFYNISPDADPWNYERSSFEQRKYRLQLALIADRSYHSALELACANGVFTGMLAPYCRTLLGVDSADKALNEARRRCAKCNGVTFQRIVLPTQFPEGTFDLVIMAEFAYYLSESDLRQLGSRIEKSTRSGARLLLTHHAIEFTATYRDHAMPSRCHDIHGLFERNPAWSHISRLRGYDHAGALDHFEGSELYLIDLFERVASVESERV